MNNYITQRVKRGNISKLNKILMLPLILITFSQCSLHELPEMEPYKGEFDMTIMDWLPTHSHIDGSNDFTMLIEALEITGLNELLSESEEYTLFAPGNITWEFFLTENGFDSLYDIPEDELRNILLYHILDGKYLRENFTPSAEDYETLLRGSFLTVSYQDIASNGVYYTMLVNTRTVLTQDIQFNNGVIHAYGMTGVEKGGNNADAQLLIP